MQHVLLAAYLMFGITSSADLQVSREIGLWLPQSAWVSDEKLFEGRRGMGGVRTEWSKKCRQCLMGRGKFKLVRLTSHPMSFEQVRAKLRRYGAIPCGQWLDAFRARFPTSFGSGPVAVADPRWHTYTWAKDAPSFPVLEHRRGRAWKRMFHWVTGKDWSAYRWLVRVRSPSDPICQ